MTAAFAHGEALRGCWFVLKRKASWQAGLGHHLLKVS